MADAGFEVAGEGDDRSSDRLVMLLDSVLSGAAWLWTVAPRLTGAGIVPGKILVGVRSDDTGRSESVERTLRQLRSGIGFGRARPRVGVSVSGEATSGARDGPDDTYRITSRRESKSEMTIERFHVAAGLEVATARMIKLRHAVLRRVLRESRTTTIDVLVAEPVPLLRLAGSRPISDTQAPTSIWFEPGFHADAQQLSTTVLHAQRTPRVLILDTDVDERVLDGQVFYLKNFIRRGPAGDGRPSNASDFREPGTHGTLVAALIQLIAPSAAIIVGRVADSDSTAARGVDGEFLLAGLLAAGDIEPPVDVVNVSIADDRPVTNENRGASDFELLSWAIARLRVRGTVVVAATGNDDQANAAGNVGFPARLDEVVAIGAANSHGGRSTFSRFGPTKPSYAAQGGDKSVGGATTEWLADLCGERAVGTSFACAIASAVIATAATSADPPNCSNTEVETKNFSVMCCPIFFVP